MNMAVVLYCYHVFYVNIILFIDWDTQGVWNHWQKDILLVFHGVCCKMGNYRTTAASTKCFSGVICNFWRQIVWPLNWISGFLWGRASGSFTVQRRKPELQYARSDTLKERATQRRAQIPGLRSKREIGCCRQTIFIARDRNNSLWSKCRSCSIPSQSRCGRMKRARFLSLSSLAAFSNGNSEAKLSLRSCCVFCCRVFCAHS